MNPPITQTSRPIHLLQASSLAFVIAGFPLAAALAQVIDVSSTPMSIGMRATTALFCAILLVASVPSDRDRIRGWLVTSCAVFMALYLVRMTNDTLLKSYILIAEPSNYWLWAVGGSIVPLFGLARAQFASIDAAKYFRWSYSIVFAAVVLALPSMTTVIENDYGSYDGGRAALNALNPISLGHLGVQLVLLSLWALFLRGSRNRPLGNALFIAGVLLGTYLTIAANSRGPLVAAMAAIVLGIVASNLKNKYWLLGLMVVALAASVPGIILVDQIAGTDTYERLFGQSQLDEVSTVARFDMYHSAWTQFVDAPLTGFGLEDSVFGSYPHNLVIEGFMATGIVGGLLMLVIMGLSLLIAYNVLRRMPQFGWIALLTVQQIVAAQFSGAISQATTMWGLIGALVSAGAVGAVQNAGRAGNGSTPPFPMPTGAGAGWR